VTIISQSTLADFAFEILAAIFRFSTIGSEKIIYLFIFLYITYALTYFGFVRFNN